MARRLQCAAASADPLGMTALLKDQIMAAIGAHGLWKGRLANAIEAGQCEFDVKKVECDDHCEFGKWLHGTIDAGSKQMPDYARVKAQHALFHKEAAKVLRMALAGQKSEATKALNGEYAKVSGDLVQLLREWRGK